MDQIKSFFSNYPAFAWGGVVVVIAIVFYIYNQANKVNSSTTANPNDSIPTYILYDATQTAPTGSTPPTTTPPSTTGHQPGSTFLGPTGVEHYVATGSETLTQIAQKFNLKNSWNAIYAIPDNQKLFGKMDHTHAAKFSPQNGLVITLPPGAF